MKPTWKWAFGNKRQKKKIRILSRRVCGCHYCVAEDAREKLRKEEAVKLLAGYEAEYGEITEDEMENLPWRTSG